MRGDQDAGSGLSLRCLYRSEARTRARNRVLDPSSSLLRKGRELVGLRSRRYGTLDSTKFS